MVSRRALLAAIGAVAVVRRVAWAQPGAGRPRRIGFLWDTPRVWPHALQAFRDGLRDLGWVDGQNLAIEFRWTEGRFDRLPALVDELVRLKVDLIMAPTSIYTGAAMRATSSIPIVFASHADPVNSGHVASLARPGKNATGLTIVMSETMAKSVELLKAAIPGLTRLAVMYDPGTPSHRPALAAVEGMGRALGLRVQVIAAPNAAAYEAAFTAAAEERAGALIVLSTPLYMGSAKPLADLALAHKMPAMFGPREHVEAGGLLSYSPDRADLYRRAAGYVDKILRGANPADLPVQQATKFELVVNLKTARALHLTIPKEILVRADHVIQ
jgi:putative ABC transport system substrate-binding protein